MRSATLAIVLLIALPALPATLLARDEGPPAPGPPSWRITFGEAEIQLSLDEGLAAVLLDEGIEEQLSFLGSLLADDPAFLAPRSSDAQAYRNLWLLRARSGLTEGELLAALDRVERAGGVLFASVVLRHDNALLIPKREILITFESAAARHDLSNLLRPGGGFQRRKELPGLRPTYLLAFDDAPAHSALDRAREVARMPGVVTAEPNFILHLEPLAVPSDPLFASQWHHQNTGQSGGTPGADLGSTLAWDLSTGSPTITIAIIDEGIDVDHEDLAAHITAGHDSTDQPNPEGIPGNALLADEHGTSCAGIAAAAGDNAIGVAGVCWNARLMPVRVGYGTHWTEIAWEVDAITWATDNGADVLSNSWGGGPPSAAVQGAIQYALTAGRGGLGCVVLFAAGNTNSDILYPAKFPETIAVGASSPCDERKSPSSCDGETWWGSNNGLELDLVAPGVLISTTDTMGTSGASTTSYRSDFNGTSAACPAAAGGAALLLSLLPGLTAGEARTYLIASCDDQVGILAEDTPGWDSFMGWGRLNLDTLLAFASAPPPPTALLCQEVGPDAQLSWLNGGAYDAIEVRRDGSLIATLPGTATSHSDPAPPFGEHQYGVTGRVAGVASPQAACSLFLTSGAGDLVWSPPSSGGPIAGGSALVSALAANGRNAILADDLATITDLNIFDHIWVNLGISPNNHVLAETDAQRLVNYLQDGIGGSQLYMEGGDTWAFDPPTTLHSLFQISGIFDGGSDLDLVQGTGSAGCDLSGITLTYGGENLFIDRLGALAPAFSIQTNTTPAYDCAVFHDQGGYRTIGASHELGGYLNGVSTRDDLMAAYLGCLFTPSSPQFIRGDVNGSGSLNLTDVVESILFLFGAGTVACEDTVDVNDNGSLNVGDPVYLIQYLFASGPQPPAPFPDPGTDPTPDGIDCAATP